MKRNHWMTVAVIALVIGVAFGNQLLARVSAKTQGTQKAQVKTQTLTIKWQRLVGDTGQTCDRCGSTQGEVRKAHALLRKSLAPLGIDVKLEEKALDKSTAAKNIAESNRIWIADKPIETWLGATSGTSDCSSCGSLVSAKSECRTVVVGQNAYESIPSALIVRAGLLAAADIVGDEAPKSRTVEAPWSGVQTITSDAPGAGGCCPR